jgi:hypothetical protein
MNATPSQNMEFVKHATTLHALGMSLEDATAELTARFSDCFTPDRARESAIACWYFFDQARPLEVAAEKRRLEADCLYDGMIALGWRPPA